MDDNNGTNEQHVADGPLEGDPEKPQEDLESLGFEKPKIEWQRSVVLDDDEVVDIELEHFVLSGVPSDPTSVGSKEGLILALISEILELQSRVVEAEAAVAYDRDRIRRLERKSQTGGGFMGFAMAAASSPLKPTPAATAAAPPLRVRETLPNEPDLSGPMPDGGLPNLGDIQELLKKGNESDGEE